MGQAHVRQWTDEILPLLEGDEDPLGVDDLTTHQLPLAEAPERLRDVPEEGRRRDQGRPQPEPEEDAMAKDHGSSVKNDKQYEGLRKKGMSKQRAASIANSSESSKKGGEKSGKGRAAASRKSAPPVARAARSRKSN